MKNIKQTITTTILAALIFSGCEDHSKNLPASEFNINTPDDGFEVEVNDTIELSPKITYDYNSTYSWVLDGKIVSEEKDLQLIAGALKKYEYTFTLNNSRGSLDTSITVQSMYTTDFEEFVFEEDVDTFWTNTGNEASFISNQIKFNVSGNYTSDTWTGFTYSNLTGSNSEDDYEKYSCYKTATDYESEVFGVLLLDEYQRPVTLETRDGENHLFKNISINNSYYVTDAITYGNNGSKKFGGDTGVEPDSLILSITGFNKNNTQRGTVNITLADYTTGSNRDNYSIKEWTTFNLEEIGKVSRLEFILISSDTEAGKINTPCFVCIDEIKIIE